MNSLNRTREQGAGNIMMILAIVFGVLTVGLVTLSIMLFMQYSDQKSDVDSKIAVAVADAKRSQSESDETKFAEREKEPNRQFVGPDDYGRLTFSYPKTWSVYVATDIIKGGTYQAYFYPGVIPPVSSDQRFALRVVIEEKNYDDVVKQYDTKVKSGDLSSSATSANGVSGTRLDGSFSKTIRGAVVIYKVRDKTVSVFTDADTFKPDFDTITKTIKFNQ